jgi:O-antigen/teichoic acid export membrane protein
MISSDVLAVELSGPPKQSLARSASRGVVWTILQSLGNRFSGTVVFLVLAHLLTPSAFGLLAIAQVFVSFSTTLADAGFTRTLVQRTELRAAHLDSALLVSGGIGVVMALGMVVGAPFLAGIYHEPKLSPVLMALAVVPVVTGVTGVPESILRRQLRFRALALRGVSSVVASGVVGIVLAVLGYGVWALVGQVVSQALVAVVALWMSVGWRPSREWNAEAVRELVGFGSHVLGISLLNFVNRRAGQFLIGLLLGPVALGLYTVATRVMSLCVDLMVASVSKVAFPVFARVAEQPQRLAAGYLRAAELSTAVTFPGFGLLAIFGPQLTPILFGSQWTDAGPLMSILSLFAPAMGITLFGKSLMLASGRSGMALRWTTVQVCITVAVIAGFAHFGLYVLAAALVTRNWLALPLNLYLVRRVAPVSLRAQAMTMVVPILGCAVMAGVALGLMQVTGLGPLADLLTAGPLGLLAYLGVLYMLRRRLFTEILGIVRRRQRAKLLRSPDREATV